MKAKISPTILSVLLALLLTTVGFAQEEQLDPDETHTSLEQSKAEEAALQQLNKQNQENENKRMQVLKDRFAKANDTKKANGISTLPLLMNDSKEMELDSYQIEEPVITTISTTTDASSLEHKQQALLEKNLAASKKAKAERELVTIAVKERLAKHDKDKATNVAKKQVWEAQKKEKALKIAQLKKLKEEKAKLINQ